MVFDSILGQQTAIQTLTRSLEAGKVHHAHRFEGPDGVGKEKAAFAFAQALLCESPVRSLGCGNCSPCQRTLRRSDTPPHVPLPPDCVLVGRGVYNKDTIGKSEVNDISIHQIRRVVLARAAYPPHEGRARVFIVRDAEQLSVGAANAMLKTLEEPRPSTYFVLLTARPDKLLDTIRSRTLPLRFAPLSDAVLRTILETHPIDHARINDAVATANGSASAALAAADRDQANARHDLASAILSATDAPTLGAGVKLGEDVGRDRHALADGLRTLAAQLAHRAKSRLRQAPDEAEIDARRHEIVLECIEALERNASQNLTIATLVLCLREGRQRRRAGAPPSHIQRR